MFAINAIKKKVYPSDNRLCIIKWVALAGVFRPQKPFGVIAGSYKMINSLMYTILVAVMS